VHGLSSLISPETRVAPGGAVDAVRPYTVVGVEDRAKEVLEAVLADEPDVVYWRAGTRHLAHVVPRLRRAGVPVVFASSHVNDLRRFAVAPNALLHPVRRSLAAARDRLRAARDHQGLLAVDALVVNNESHLGLVPVEPQRFIPNGTDRTARPFRWPRPYVAWVANLKPAKRPEACIPLAEAIADLDVDVVMAGRIAVDAYRWFEDEGRLPSNLHYLGPVEQVDANGILAGARCHVHTCRPEGFSNVFIQAWAAGVPSVSLGFDPEGTIVRERLGAVCDEDPARFSAEVRKMLEDPTRRDAAAARAARYALSRFDTVRNVATLEEFLARLVDAPGVATRGPDRRERGHP
jgi:glycosyltransferase involved in cell wall biosynthesis